MKLFNGSCLFLCLALFVALSVQTNTRCSRATALSIPTTSHRYSLLDLKLSLLDIINLQLSLLNGNVYGGWYVVDGIDIDAFLRLNVCAVNSAIDVDVFVYEGSCNNLQLITSKNDCCGVDIDIDVRIGRKYYILLLADVKIDCLLDLRVRL